jgi:hypothetical protein
MFYGSSELFTYTAKSLIWILRMNKLKPKYNVLAQYNLERLLLSTALFSINQASRGFKGKRNS